MSHGQTVWTLQYRRVDADAEDFCVTSLHETEESAKAEAEEESNNNGDEGFAWRRDEVTGVLYYERPDEDSDLYEDRGCYMVELWNIKP